MVNPMPNANPTTFPCSGCGAELEFKPGTAELACPHCGSRTPIAPAAEVVEEIDYASTLAQLADQHDAEDRIVVHCESCGANVPLEPNVTSQACPFCGSNIVATGQSTRVLRPRALLPFGVTSEQARARFGAWLSGLWFAPSDLKRLASVERVALASGSTSSGGTALVGMYVPYWTFDARSVTPYTGQRGDNYTVPVSYTVMVNGRPQVQTRLETRIRWSGVSGCVGDAFDDVLVHASTSLPADRLAALGAWDLRALVPYDDRYLSGFRSESYTIDLPHGFEAARAVMVEGIKATIRRDIGGDHQRIHSMSPQFSAITFKHVLLPIWISTFRYRGTLFRFLVNARTGQVSGQRPYSAWKIAAVVLAILMAVGVIIFLASRS